jgi:hypothetical protein
MKGFFREETEQWKRTRLSAWAAIAPHSKRKMTPEQWLPLPGDGAGGMTLERALEQKQRLYDLGILKRN